MKNKIYFLKTLAVIAIISILAFNIKEGKPNFSTRKVAFNSGWNFHLNDSIKDKDTINTTTTWKTLNLPHDWSIEGKFDEKSPAGYGEEHLTAVWVGIKKLLKLPLKIKIK
jgi:beta-galactosidase